MKHITTLLTLSVLLTAAIPVTANAQRQWGIRILLFQNDLDLSGSGNAQAFHAGEWQSGVWLQRNFKHQFSSRIELNFTHGRYRFSGDGNYFWLHSDRFSYLSAQLLPQWRAKKVVSIGAGPFISVRTDGYPGYEEPFDGGLLFHLGLRYKPIEINWRFQRFFAAGYYTLGVGLDYFWDFKKKKAKVQE